MEGYLIYLFIIFVDVILAAAMIGAGICLGSIYNEDEKETN